MGPAAYGGTAAARFRTGSIFFCERRPRPRPAPAILLDRARLGRSRALEPVAGRCFHVQAARAAGTICRGQRVGLLRVSR